MPASAESVDQVASALKGNRRIYDGPNRLSTEDERRIDRVLLSMQQRNAARGAIVIVARLDGETPENFGRELGERWKLGSAGTDNGFVIMVSVGDRKWFTSVAQGLQGVLPDALVTRLGRETMRPGLRSGDYGQGILDYLAAIDQRLQRDAAATGTAGVVDTPSAGPSPLWGLLAILAGLGAVVVNFASWPRGGTAAKDRTQLPVILLSAASLAGCLLGGLEGDTGAYLLAVGPLALLILRLGESQWAPVPVHKADDLSRNVLGSYAVVAILPLFVMAALLRSGWTIGYVLLSATTGFALLEYFRRVPRACPKCDGALRWLPEEEEASVLHAEETAEQQVRSFDYDVWRCGKCGKSAVKAHRLPSSRAAACPDCRRRTVLRHTVLRPETVGLAVMTAEEVDECRNPACSYRKVIQVREVSSGGYRDDGFGGIIILPMYGGWGGSWDNSSGGWGSDGGWGSNDGGGGGIDFGDFGGGGGFDGGGGGGDF